MTFIACVISVLSCIGLPAAATQADGPSKIETTASPRTPPTALALRLGASHVEINAVHLLHQLVVAFRESSRAIDLVEQSLINGALWPKGLVPFHDATPGTSPTMRLREEDFAVVRDAIRYWEVELASIALVKRRVLHCDDEASVLDLCEAQDRPSLVFPQRRAITASPPAPLDDIDQECAARWAEHVLKSVVTPKSDAIEVRVWKCVSDWASVRLGLRGSVDTQSRVALAAMLVTPDYHGSFTAFAEPAGPGGSVEFTVEMQVEDTLRIRGLALDLCMHMSAIALLAQRGSGAWCDVRALQATRDANDACLRLMKLCRLFSWMQHMAAAGDAQLVHPSGSRAPQTLDYRDRVSIPFGSRPGSNLSLMVGAPGWVTYECDGRRYLRSAIGLRRSDLAEDVVSNWIGKSPR